MCTYNLGWSLLGISAVHYCHDALGKAQESLTGDGIDLGSSRRTIITTLADALNDRNLGEQRHIHLLSEILATLLTCLSATPSRTGAACARAVGGE